MGVSFCLVYLYSFVIVLYFWVEPKFFVEEGVVVFVVFVRFKNIVGFL